GADDLVGELEEQLLHQAGVDLAEARHRLRELLDLLVVHPAEQLGGVILADGEHEDRGLVPTRQRPDVFTHWHLAASLPACVHDLSSPGTSTGGRYPEPLPGDGR